MKSYKTRGIDRALDVAGLRLVVLRAHPTPSMHATRCYIVETGCQETSATSNSGFQSASGLKPVRRRHARADTTWASSSIPTMPARTS